MRKVLSFLFKAIRELFWLAVAAAIIAGGFFGFQYLGENREVVEAEVIERSIPLVEVQELVPLSGYLPIRGQGFVTPFREQEISSQVSGRVTYVNPALFERGTFSEGDVLIRLDDRSAVAALEQAQANIEATQARIDQNAQDIERVRRLVAGGSSTRTQLDNLLTTRDELAANLSGFMAAHAAAEIAQEERTVLAPFSGAVLSEDVEIGDVVAAGQALAIIFTNDQLEVDVPIRQADAALIPGLFAGARATAQIEVSFAGQRFRWHGEVARVQSELDPRTRTLLVTIALSEFDDAAGRTVTGEELEAGAPPALINSFAYVTIDGASAENAFEIPSTALRTNSEVWLYRDGELAVQEVTPVHVDGETTFIRANALARGDLVITSQLAAAVPGMALRETRATIQATLMEQ